MPPNKRTPIVEYLKTQRKWDAVLKGILEDAARDLDRDIRALDDTAGPLARAQLLAQRASIKAHLSQDFADIGKAIREGQKDAAAAASLVVSQFEDDLFSLVMDPEKRRLIAISEAQRAASSVQTVMARLQISQRTLSSQVYVTAAGVNSQVDKAINSALARGLSAREFAREVKQFVNPNTPGGASYAAMRLARTEINNAFHATTIQRFQSAIFVDNVEWNLSSSHPEGDHCDTLADESPYPKRSVPEKPHPQCFCFLTAEMPSEDDFIDNLFAGKYDEANWSDDVMTGEAGKAPTKPTKPLGPTSDEIIRNAEKMYGTGSKQHMQAVKKQLMNNKKPMPNPPWKR
jgi:hypothetical protein